MAGRDPAFLYYDADVALDVAHMDRLERGCYFDLVQMYRKYHGYTMVQIRKILGIDYDRCWNAIELVLVYEESDQKYHVPWLRQSLEKKAQRNEKQRKNVQTRWDKEKARKAEGKSGNTTVIPPYENGNTKNIPIIETVTETETETETQVGGTGEGPPKNDFRPTGFSNFVVLAMLDRFQQSSPGYPTDGARDGPALLEIAKFLSKRGNLRGAPEHNADAILEAWGPICEVIAKDDFYCQKSLTTIERYMQEILQKTLNGDKSKALKSVSGRGRSLDDEKLKTLAAERFKSR